MWSSVQELGERTRDDPPARAEPGRRSREGTPVPGQAAATLPRRADLSIAAHYAPLDQVSGDIYDVLELEPSCLRIFLADATGHGVQASMRTLLLKSTYDRLKGLFNSPSELLAALNAHLVSEFPDGDLHCSACCIDVRPDAQGAEVHYSNAGGVPL